MQKMPPKHTQKVTTKNNNNKNPRKVPKNGKNCIKSKQIFQKKVQKSAN